MCAYVQLIRQQLHTTKLFNTLPVIFYVIFWSDDFEGAMFCKNKNYVQIKTINICPLQDQITSSRYTYAVALGC